MGHLDDFELAAFFEDSVAAKLRVRVLDEIARCAECRHLVAALAREHDQRAAKDDPLGRYEIRERLGSGAWGAVYRAYDPVLKRDVAIKLVLLRSEGREARVKLKREGQLLARSEHPNVLRLFDAVEVGDDVALVTEFVAGGTLETWLNTRPGIDAVLGAFRAAARGLDAAHRVGVVHGDFKPRNVLVDGDRVVVADFGLGHLDAPTPTGEDRVGSLVDPTWGGTPAYLSPERAEGGPATAQSDQYAFGVALADALEPIPGHLKKPLRRLRARDPAARYSTMLKAAEALTSARPRWGLALGGGVALLAGLSALPLLGQESPARPPRPDPLVYDSDEPGRQALERARRLLEEHRHAEVLETLNARFDLSTVEHSEAWAYAANYAAKAEGMVGNTQAHARLSAAAADVAVEIGDSGLAAEATVARLQARLQQTFTPEVRVLLRKAEAYAQRAVEQPGNDMADFRTLVEVELARAAVQTGEHEFDAALDTLRAVLPRARAQLGPDALILSRLQEFRSKVRLHLGRHDDAKTDAQEALDRYERVRGPDAVEVAEPLRILMHVASGAGELETALSYADRAVRVLVRAHGEGGLRVARALKTRGGMHAILRNFALAEADLQRAQAILEASENVDIDLTDVFMNLARIRSWQDKPEAALRLLDRSVVLAEGVGRADIVARAVLERCRVHVNAGDGVRAGKTCDAAAVAFTALFGVSHPARSEIEELRRKL